MRCTAAAVVAVACLAAAVTAATTVLEIADDAGSITMGTTLDTTLTRRSPGVLGTANLQIDTLLNVTGQAVLGSASGPVVVRNALQVGGATTLSGTTTMSGTTTLSGTTTVSGATTHTGTTAFNAQTTFSAPAPVVNTDLFVTGIIHHGNVNYHRTRLMGITAKIYAGYSQDFQPCGSPATTTCTPGMMVVGFTHAGDPGGIGTYNDGWAFPAHNMWRGSNLNTNPSSGFSAQNGFSIPTDPATGSQLVGFYRVTGSINLGGCTENAFAGTSSGTSTYRALYITSGYNSPTNPDYLRYFGGTIVREAWPKEVSLSVTDTVLMQPNAWVWLSLTNNCVAPNTISTKQPIGPPTTLGGSGSAIPGLYALFSITYIGE